MLQRKAKCLFQVGLDACIVQRIVRTLVKVGLATTTTIAITDLPNNVIYVCVTDMLHKSVGSTVRTRVGRCVSHGRDTMSV